MFWFKKKKDQAEEILPIGSYRIVPYCENEFSEKVWRIEIWTDIGKQYSVRYIWHDWQTSKLKYQNFNTPEEAEKTYLDWKKLSDSRKEFLAQEPIIRIKQ